MRRGRMSHGYSKKVFRNGAQRIHPKNAATIMRGGFRI